MLNEILVVKKWIVRKNLSLNEVFAVEEIGCEGVVVRETEKAVNLKFKTNYGNIYMWCPKSQTMTLKESYEEELKIQDYYESLLAFCKKNGLRVRKGMKIATMKAKLEEAGLTF